MTTNTVEVYEQASNTWRDMAPMREAREGDSVCVFEHPNQLFIFGGMSMEKGKLDSIEQYDIIANEWKYLVIKLVRPIANLVSHSLGREKVLILGYYQSQIRDPETDEQFNYKQKVLQILDLSAQINKVYEPKTDDPIEDIYMPSFLDQSGQLYIFKGCPDNQPAIIREDIAKLIKLYIPPK